MVKKKEFESSVERLVDERQSFLSDFEYETKLRRASARGARKREKRELSEDYAERILDR